ncbi:MAG TPA: PhoH family protein [Casimicrobiaceae bacterium]|nr:PhoH family protein [Casimicrobiaceae bacterium]
MTTRRQLTLAPLDNRALANLTGPLDANLRQIEAALDVTIARRGGTFDIAGKARDAGNAAAAIERFYAEAEAPLSVEDIQLGLVEVVHARGRNVSPRSALRAPPPAGGRAPRGGRSADEHSPRSAPLAGPSALIATRDETDDGAPVLHTRRADLHGRSPNQVAYLKAITSHDITFGIGPAGTGKTYLAVACAVDALERDAVKRIVLVRPAVEAGERLGFLPGDLAQKVDPYLRPLYDAMYDLMGFDKVGKLLERQAIELAPLAYMRGRTLNHSFIILDEAQNTTPEQMKMFLTRIGFSSKAVITGDVTQIDLARGQKSGLIEAERVLRHVRGIAFCKFTSADVVRHPLVQKIIDAYDRDASP